MSEPPSTSKASAPRRRPVGPRKQARLGDTLGPEPATPPAQTRLAIGVILGSHGVRGEVKLRLFTDEPEHLRSIKRVWVGAESNSRRLLGVRFQGDIALIRLQGITTPEAATELRGETVRIAGADARPLAAGEFFLYQLVGLEAFDETGAPVGRVTDIIETGANDVLVLTPPDSGPDILLPNHPDTVLDVRPDEGRMTVRRLVYGN
ncbi:MAG TPA: ribosome maturation factor RimM [Thermomicrobiales bacterium]|nr:ribosome maturation factor RimM [Thermomicrobiales bacterium]